MGFLKTFKGSERFMRIPLHATFVEPNRSRHKSLVPKIHASSYKIHHGVRVRFYKIRMGPSSPLKTLAKRLPAGAVPRFPQGGSEN